MAAPVAGLQLNSNTLQAQNISILNQTTNVHQAPANSPLRPMDILREHVAFGALHDSAERFDPPKCHPQTRTAIRDCIDEWARDVSNTAKPILWLSGAAGAGKSAITQTLVESWNEQGITTIAFFFWRTRPQCNQKTHLIPTLAFQLAERFSSARSRIEEAIESGGVFKRSLASQLEKLVTQPLLASDLHDHFPIVVVIDGLDECCVDLPEIEGFEGQDHESQQREILEGVASACQKTLALKFMIASRPERQIRESFGEGSLNEYTFPLSLNHAPNAKADIKLFLECRFEEIRRRHGIDPSWPSEDQISTLIRKSSEQFVYPSIAMKHISRPRTNPVESLKDVLELQAGSTDNPLTELDRLYTLVLKSVSSKSLPIVNDVLGRIILGQQHVFGFFFDDYDPMEAVESPSVLEEFFFLPHGELLFHLTDLHSVLDIPPCDFWEINIIHATFSEYLQDESRSGEFFISKESTYCRYAHFSLRHIEECLNRRNFKGYTPPLIEAFVDSLEGCPPSKNFMERLWSMMETDIGPHPSLHIGAKTLTYKHKVPSINIVSGIQSLRGLIEEWNQTDSGYESIHMERELSRIIIYLLRCNLPDNEPSRWRRYITRRRLEIAKLRLLGGCLHVGPVSNTDIALNDGRLLALELTRWLNSFEGICRSMMPHKFWIHLLFHLTSFLKP